MMIAEDIRIECEENGFQIVVDGETWRIADPEALYDRVKAAIGPWLYERDQAHRDYRLEAAHRRLGVVPRVFACNPDESGGFAMDDGSGYDRSDPKHPDFHSVHADIWDSRAGK